jgi:hypothetical protein
VRCLDATNKHQHQAEFASLLTLFQRERITSYLEIGSKYGWSLWRVASILPMGSRVVAVDMTIHINSLPDLRACIYELKRRKYDAHLFVGDSTSEAVVNKVRALAPFDACLIDANHSAAYVNNDWSNYGPMARIVAFHDVGYKLGERVADKIYPIEVPQVWNAIKQDYPHQEIILDPSGQDNGFGVLWRH